MFPVRESIAWFQRARRVIPKEHRSVLLNPVRLAVRFLAFAGLRVVHRDHRLMADDVAARDPQLVELFHDGFRILAKTYFRLRTEGVENVPATGPVLLVGNHSGALVPTEGFFTAFALHERFGSGRALYALVHDFVFEDPLLRGYALRLGMLRAGHESARHALDAGHCVLVYPGSDLDVFRPFRDRHKVVLAGRKGFLQLALRAQVPIVPVVTLGTHEQLIVLTRGDRLAKLLDRKSVV
jgi:1-acyl-sn-glycerol-3-phosphate acyltransferase